MNVKPDKQNAKLSEPLSQTNVASVNKIVTCAMCYQSSDHQQNECRYCGTPLHVRKKNSLQNTVALLITSLVLYVPANIYPIMYTTSIGDELASTIIGGVITLWEQQFYPIALIIFVASVMVPVAKILALGWLVFSVQRNRIISRKSNQIMFRITEFIGRWSMVDIFAVTILVALIERGNLMKVMPGVALIAFAAMVVTTMLAAFSFESRLIWDNPDKNKGKNTNV
jgi:paraquat-inducible protein A